MERKRGNFEIHANFIFNHTFILNDQFYNPFSRTGARTRQKLAKWVVKPNHYKALGFTTHLTKSKEIGKMGCKT